MSMDVFKLPVFPAADVFEMMREDELQDLADDIAANGLREPLVIAEVEIEDDDGNPARRTMLIDGRNRREACKRANVSPSIRELKGEDLKAFVISANIHRRHMSKGQRAMAVAMIYPTPEQGKRKTSLKNSEVGISRQYVGFARAVLAHSRSLAESVRAGAKALSDAYQEVQLATGKTNNEKIRLRKLREKRPDLADAVEAEEMTLDEAFATEKLDAEEEKSRRWTFTRNLIDAVRGLERDIDQANKLAADYDPVCAEGFGDAVTPERLRRAAEFASALADQMENPETPYEETESSNA